MDKDSTSPPQKIRSFYLLHQVLAVTHINFAEQILVGYTELRIKLLNPDQKTVHLNAKQCKIFRITVNDTEADFSLIDPTLDVCQVTNKKRGLDYYSASHANIVRVVDADNDGGELAVTLPQTYGYTSTNSGSAPFTRRQGHDIVTVSIEFMVEKPEAGIMFVVPPYHPEKSFAERGAYFITGGHENSSRLWFPCVDSFSETCTWKIEITVEKSMTAVSCGDLTATLPTPDQQEHTFYYELNIPACAPRIALAVGPFEILTDPHMNEMQHYCLPGLLPLMKDATCQLHDAFEFCEEYLSCRNPYGVYRQVFVDRTYSDLMSYATMSIVDCSYLFPKSVIELNLPSRTLMALGVCQQFFGCYLNPASWKDVWISNGVARYLQYLYVQKRFGNNEYRYQILQMMKEVTTFEHTQHPIVLVPPKDPHPSFPFCSENPQTCSEEYIRLCSIKAHLVIRLLEERIQPQVLAQVLNKSLALAATAAGSKEQESWSSMLLSTEEFVKGINTVTAKDIQPFMDTWVYAGGHARFKGRFSFNRKKNTVEMELSQETGVRGCAAYTGPLPIFMQELDGSNKHVVQVEENSNRQDLVCHSKTRRHKKKRIPIWTGEEIDIDLNEADADCPVLWMRFDPDLTIIRTITVEQPDYQLLYIVRHERDVVAQLAALDALNAYPTPTTKAVLGTVVENERMFYRIRLAAAEALTKLSNQLAATGVPWSSPPPLYAFFKKLFFVRLPSSVTAGAHVASNIVKRNDFSDFIKYFLQKTVPICIAKIRNANNLCPPEIVTMLLDLWKYNENRRNFFSDSYYRAALIEAFGETFTESAGTLSVSEDTKFQFEQLDTLAKQCMENVFRAMNQEKYLPSFQYCVTVSCLNAFRSMHKHGILPQDWCVKIYKEYTDPKLFRTVRISAFGHMISHLQTTAKNSPNHELFDLLLTAAATDPDLYVRHVILQQLTRNPPFTKDTAKPEDCALSSEKVVDRLWTWMNSGAAYDARIRTDLVDLYHVLYGRRRPACVPIPDLGMVLNLKERKALLSDAAMASLEDHHNGISAESADAPQDVQVINSPQVQLKVSGPIAPVLIKEEPDLLERESTPPQSRETPDSPLLKLKIKIPEAPPSAPDAPQDAMEEDGQQRKKRKKHKHKSSKHHHDRHNKHRNTKPEEDPAPS